MLRLLLSKTRGVSGVSILLVCIIGHLFMGCVFICFMNVVGHQHAPSLHVKTAGDYQRLNTTQRQDTIRLLELQAYGRSHCIRTAMEHADASAGVAGLDRMCQLKSDVDICLVPVELHVLR